MKTRIECLQIKRGIALDVGKKIQSKTIGALFVTGLCGMIVRRIRFQCLLYFFLLGSASLTASTVVDELAKEERESLKELFTVLLSDGDFAYTLAGSKPMCCVTYQICYAQEISKNPHYQRETFLVRKGFETWNQLEHLFNMNEFTFLAKEDDESTGTFSFYLINKHKVLTVIKTHLALFQDHFGKNFSAESILKKVCETQIFNEIPLNHQLIGLLLGYPLEDVKAFCEKLEYETLITLLPYNYKIPRKGANMSIKLRDDDFEARKRRNFNLKTIPLVPSKSPFRLIRTPYFRSERNSRDLSGIIDQYSIKKKSLIQLYYDPLFLEKILERFL